MLLLKSLWNYNDKNLTDPCSYTSINYLFEVNSKQEMKVIIEMTNTGTINAANIIHSDSTFPIELHECIILSYFVL
jgi:hypothetical protein